MFEFVVNGFALIGLIVVVMIPVLGLREAAWASTLRGIIEKIKTEGSYVNDYSYQISTKKDGSSGEFILFRGGNVILTYRISGNLYRICLIVATMPKKSIT